MPTTSLELLTSAVQTKTNNHLFITNARNARDENGIYFGWEITHSNARNISFSLQGNLANCGEESLHRAKGISSRFCETSTSLHQEAWKNFTKPKYLCLSHKQTKTSSPPSLPGPVARGIFPAFLPTPARARMEQHHLWRRGEQWTLYRQEQSDQTSPYYSRALSFIVFIVMKNF